MRLKRRLALLWRWLTEPLPFVQDPEKRLQARWLASLLVMSLPLGVPVAAVHGFVRPGRTVRLAESEASYGKLFHAVFDGIVLHDLLRPWHRGKGLMV
jgi:hypothetical protein